MAILNVTPDSFSDGGQLVGEDRLVAAVQRQLAGGATVIDIGGESTRPGATTIAPEMELARVLPAIALIRERFPEAVMSVDTRKAAVARQALAAGASWVNDVSGLRHDPQMVHVVAEAQATLVLMHSVGTPETMQQQALYPDGDVVSAVYDWLARQSDYAIVQGVNPEKLWLDVGFGFGKTVAHNLSLLKNLGRFQALGFPVLVGVSRKSFLTLGHPELLPPDQREPATALAHGMAWQQGAQGFRVHEAGLHRAALAFCQAMGEATVAEGESTPATGGGVSWAESSEKTLAPPGSGSCS